MILALCADDKMGLQFNKRRQSRDTAVISDLTENSQVLWIHPDSGKLFVGYEIRADENYLSMAEVGQWCFCEDTEYLNYSKKIEKIVLYRWNRVYPADLFFEFPGQWKLASSRDFPGTSHEKITREEYVK